MKTLIILRHGKAEPYKAKQDDFDRVLTDTGKRDVADMGRVIFTQGGMPDLILASKAKRTVETAVIAAETLHYPKKNIQTNEDLYLAATGRILKLLSKLPDEVNSCVLVGHNPGVTDLVNYLGVGLDNLPTASAVCFTFGAESWNEISPANAAFRWVRLARKV